MTAEVLNGTFYKAENFTLYENKLSQNVRIIFNYLSLEGTGTHEMVIQLPAATSTRPNYSTGAVESTNEVQIPNINDRDNVFMEGTIGKQLSSSGTTHGTYKRIWWGAFSHLGSGWWYPWRWNWYNFYDHSYWSKYTYNYGNWRGHPVQDGGDNVHGFMWSFSNQATTYYGWRINNRLEEVPFPTEIMLAPGQKVVFKVRTRTTIDPRNPSVTLATVPQYITYNVLAIPENG